MPMQRELELMGYRDRQLAQLEQSRSGPDCDEQKDNSVAESSSNRLTYIERKYIIRTLSNRLNL